MATSPARPNSALLVFFRDKLGYNRELLLIDAFQWLCILFLLFGPLVSWHMDHVLTVMCNKMAESWTGIIIITVGVAIWVLLLWINYQQAHAKKFDFEYTFDALEARIGPIPAQIRSSSRRRQFVRVVNDTVFASCIIVYYEIWIAFSVIVRKGINPMKTACAGTPLSFRFFEKIYLQQFVKDLPFSAGDLVDLYGKCAPDPEVYAVKVLTTLASALHWFLILFLVGFLWRKQIRTWFFPDKPEATPS